MGNISQTPFIPAPLIITPDGALSAGAGAAVVAGSAYLSAVAINATVTIQKMRTIFSGAPTGNCDMGIYDSLGTNGLPLNLLGHTGAIAATTGLFTQNLTANLTLPPGVYWIAIVDTVADSVWQRGAGAAGAAAVVKTSATNLTVLPSTIGATANNNLIMLVDALPLGGFS